MVPCAQGTEVGTQPTTVAGVSWDGDLVQVHLNLVGETGIWKTWGSLQNPHPSVHIPWLLPAISSGQMSPSLTLGVTMEGDRLLRWLNNMQ